jgi:hypothetical protein
MMRLMRCLRHRRPHQLAQHVARRKARKRRCVSADRTLGATIRIRLDSRAPCWLCWRPFRPRVADRRLGGAKQPLEPAERRVPALDSERIVWLVHGARVDPPVRTLCASTVATLLLHGHRSHAHRDVHQYWSCKLFAVCAVAGGQ